MAPLKFALANCSRLVAAWRLVMAENNDPGPSVCQINSGEGGSCQFQRSCCHARAVRFKYWRLTRVYGEDRESAHRSPPEEIGPERGFGRNGRDLSTALRPARGVCL